MTFHGVTMGIPAPEGPAHTIEFLTVEDRRKAIDEAQLHSPVVRRVLESARHERLNSEETYMYLAYVALRLLEDAHQRELHHLRHAPMPIYLIPKKDLPRG